MPRLSFIASLSSLALVVALGGCAGMNAKTETLAERDKQTMYKFGSAFGTDGGLSLFGGNKRKGGDESGIGVNGFLWRASLDTVSFMPIVTADPFGGVILTDWYSPPGTGNERFKINIYILDRQLRADGVRVAVFRQVQERGGWRDVAVSADTAANLEETVLTRARQLRITQNAGS